MKALVAHPGTQYGPKLAAELAAQDLLYRYWTGFGFTAEGIAAHLHAAAPSGLRRALANRRLTGIPARRLHTRPLLDLRAWWRVRKGESSEKVLYDRNRRFQNAISDHELASADAVIGFDTSSWILAERCRRLGRPFLLDQSIGHPRAKEAAYAEIAERFPEWSDQVQPKEESMIELEELEHANATRIVAASTFSRKTLIENGVPDEKVIVLPYGVDLNRFCLPSSSVAPRPFRFLFVGLVNARKGAPLLLDAWRRIHKGGSELWVVGPISDTTRRMIPDLPGLHVMGGKPHNELPAIFAKCDVFVFPTFFEGFGLVLLEALASGLQVITTTATAGPDIIADSKVGSILNPGDGEALVVAMEAAQAAAGDRPETARLARKEAERWSWKVYGDGWANVLDKVPDS